MTKSIMLACALLTLAACDIAPAPIPAAEPFWPAVRPEARPIGSACYSQPGGGEICINFGG